MAGTKKTTKQAEKSRNYSVVDIFCGVGGLTHGLKREGFNVVADYDLDSSCKYAYEANNQHRYPPKSKLPNLTSSLPILAIKKPNLSH